MDADLVGQFLDELNLANPGLDLKPRDVMRTLWGFLPVRGSCEDKLVTREVIRHHADLGGPQGLVSISGVKFTTARRVGEKTLRATQRWQGRKLSEPAEIPPPATRSPESWRNFEQMLGSDSDRARSYVRRLVTEESVVRLEDLMLRRTDWALDPKHSGPREAVVESLLE